MSGLAGDIFSIGADLIALVRAHELQAAIRKVNERLRAASAECFAANALAITEINRFIKAAELERERVLAEIGKLPSDERRHAALELKGLVDRLFSDEIARLRSRKRTLSRGG